VCGFFNVWVRVCMGFVMCVFVCMGFVMCGFCNVCVLLIDLTVPPTKRDGGTHVYIFIQVPLTCNYMNIKTKLLEGKHKIYFGQKRVS